MAVSLPGYFIIFFLKILFCHFHLWINHERNEIKEKSCQFIFFSHNDYLHVLPSLRLYISECIQSDCIMLYIRIRYVTHIDRYVWSACKGKLYWALNCLNERKPNITWRVVRCLKKYKGNLEWIVIVYVTNTSLFYIHWFIKKLIFIRPKENTIARNLPEIILMTFS